MTPRTASTRRWPVDHLARVRRLRIRMAELKVDAVLVSFDRDIRYLTGFSGEDAWALVEARGLTLFSDRRFETELSERFGYVRSVMRKGSLTDTLSERVASREIGRVAIQAEHLSVAARQAIAKKIGARRLLETSGLLTELREIKDGGEVRQIRRAVRVQEAAFARMLEAISPGMTEREVCARLEFEMKLGGADGPAFATIVATGPGSAMPHYQPADVKVRAGAPLLIDFGAVVEGYHSDMTRVVAFGRMPKKIAEIYRIVEAAQHAAIDRIAPGVSIAEVDAAARDVIRKAGYAKQFSHGLGHGIGLEIHEGPRVGQKVPGELVPGHVITVEPGIYLPGSGGVRLEDDILVTPGGHENLCSLPTDLESAII